MTGALVPAATARGELERELERYAQDLAPLVKARGVQIVVVTGQEDKGASGAVRRAFPQASVTALFDEVLSDARFAALANGPVPQLVVHCGGASESALEGLRQLPWLLPEGGLYLALGVARMPRPRGAAQVPRDASALVADLYGWWDSQERPHLPGDASLARAVRLAGEGPRSVLLRKRGGFLMTLREHEADAALASRMGDTWGHAVVVQSARTVESRAVVRHFGEAPDMPSLERYKVPALTQREYADVEALPRQILRNQQFYLPDTFRHAHQSRLSHRGLDHVHARAATLRTANEPRTRRHLSGTYYYLDTEYPGHFGHVMMDVVARTWRWPDVRAQFPDARVLVSTVTPEASLPAWQYDIFAACGIAADDVEVIGRDESVTAERVIGVTPALENPRYAHPVLEQVWSTLTAGLDQVASPVDADRIFVTRERNLKRACLDADAVEEFFTNQGFVLVFPERYTVAEQFALFRRARVVAGYAGSGMFSMLANPQAHVLILTPSAYTAKNEELIAAVNGNRVDYLWGPSVVAQPDTGWSLEAFVSDWRFDMDAMAPLVLEALRDD